MTQAVGGGGTLVSISNNLLKMNSSFSSLKVILLLVVIVGAGYFISMQVGNKNVDQSGVVASAAGNGASVIFVSQSVAVTPYAGQNNDLVEYTIKFKIKAPTSTPIYVSSTAGYLATSKFRFAIDKAGTPLTQVQYVNSAMGTTVNMTDDDLTMVGNYNIEPGEEETFAMTVTMQNNPQIGTGLFRTKLTNIKWNTTDSATVYSNFTNLPGFQTNYIAVN